MICEYVDVNREKSGGFRFVEDLGFNSYDFMSIVGMSRSIDEVDEREVVICKDSKGRHGVYPVPAAGCLRREKRRNGSKYITGDRKPTYDYGSQTALRYKVKRELEEKTYEDLHRDAMAFGRMLKKRG